MGDSATEMTSHRVELAKQQLMNYDDARKWAAAQDEQDELREFRNEFFIPSQRDLQATTLSRSSGEDNSPPSIYLCGNSLGLQPKSATTYIQSFLTQWRTKAVLGHFVDHTDAILPPFLHVDDHAAKLMAPLVGANVSEVAVMGTLTANLHFMMAAFYRPAEDKSKRYKVLLEGKAFPSDHYAIESHVRRAGYDPKDAMILLEPLDPAHPLLPTQQILDTIDKHKDKIALVLLPGIQFYTGQYFDIKTITTHAHSHDITVGWDCAHAAGNVDLKLHDWDVDFAVWCTYKYLNSGPGAMAGIFVHDKHGHVVERDGALTYQPRLAGWWGHDKSSRFQMTQNFVPRPGAAGFQLSNPSALDLAAVVASLDLFNKAGMDRLRQKSLRMTQFLEHLLASEILVGPDPPYTIITSTRPEERGAQLSVRLNPRLLEVVLHELEENGVIIDERKPDVIRVAPAPLYNSYQDVCSFCEIFSKALKTASSQQSKSGSSVQEVIAEELP